MIAAMNRKAFFSNPMVTKSASGGTTTDYDEWAEVWCEYRKRDGSTSGNGSQQNVNYNVVIRVRYSEEINTYLNKDTKITVKDIDHQVIDFTVVDDRSRMIEIKAVTKLKGTVKETTSNMRSFLFIQGGGVADDEGADFFTVAALKNRTIISIESFRAVPLEIITTGTPAEDEIKYAEATGRFEVAATAPWSPGEKMRVIYK